MSTSTDTDAGVAISASALTARPASTGSLVRADCATSARLAYSTGGIARSARSLDVIFMPLVGFDARGSRVGMGKGYYDRALAFLHHRRTWRRPLLVGLAFACQQVDALPTRAHDVPLDHIVTEAGSHRFIRPRPFT